MKNYVLALTSIFLTTVITGCQAGPYNNHYDGNYEQDPYAFTTLISDDTNPLSGYDVELLVVLPLPEEELQIIQPEMVEPETRTFIISSDLLFDFDKSELKHSSSFELNNFFNELVKQFDSIESISVEGHTDRLGTNEYNYNLAIERATNVRHALVINGIPTSMISVKSFGETQPLTDGCYNVKDPMNTKVCLAPDRRVEIKVLGTAVVEELTPPNALNSSMGSLNAPNPYINAPSIYNQ